MYLLTNVKVNAPVTAARASQRLFPFSKFAIIYPFLSDLHRPETAATFLASAPGRSSQTFLTVQTTVCTVRFYHFLEYESI